MASLSGKLPNIRALYCAGPGNKLLQADYKQLELRVMAAVSGAQVLEEAINTGDVYTEDAKAIFRLPAHMTKCKCKGACLLPLDHVKDSARQTSKQGHLGFQYGCGLPTFHQQMIETDQSIKFSTSMLVFDALRKRYAGTVEYWGREMKVVLKTGYSETRILQNRRRYPAPPELSEVANYPIQGTAAEIANIAMVDLYRALAKSFGDKAFITMQMHDAFVVEFAAALEEKVLKVVQSCMEQPFVIEGRSWVFPVDIKVGHAWSDV